MFCFFFREFLKSIVCIGINGTGIEVGRYYEYRHTGKYGVSGETSGQQKPTNKNTKEPHRQYNTERNFCNATENICIKV